MTRSSARKAAQQSFEFRREGRHPRWGGRRKGAGRKKSPRGSVSHVKRERLKKHEPQHVTLRLAAEVADVRRWRFWGALVSAIAKSARKVFQVGAWSIQEGHLHLVTEADGWKALSDGVRGLEIRLARAINRLLKRKGRVFSDRYHVRALSTPTEVRNALVYVLTNARKHFRARGVVPRRDWIDKFSSAPWFDGWRVEMMTAVSRARAEIVSRVSPPEFSVQPRTWLLRSGWRRHGLLGSGDVPAS